MNFSQKFLPLLNHTAFKKNIFKTLKFNQLKSNFKNDLKTFNTRSNFQLKSSKYSNKNFILKSGLFTVAFSGGCFSIAVIANYERTRAKKNFSLVDNVKFSEFRRKINNFWNSLPDVKKAVIVIILLNSLVFIGWRIPALQNLFHKYFLLSPISGINSQMLFSTFSHQQLFHIGFNMIALYSMSDLICRILPLEQFVAFYLSSGVFASFSSSLIKCLRSTHNSFSLGASGAIISCFALSSLIFPHSKFYVFPIPFEIEAQSLLKGLVLFDLVCLFIGSRRMDHAAHLGGALYGLLFLNFGPSWLNQYQSYIVQKWKNLRS